jgi:hypothetical protein
MTKYLVLALFAACFLSMGAFAFAADKDHAEHGDLVCLYKDEGFHGHEQCYRPGDSVSDLKHAEIESVRVYGRARAILYEERDFQGPMIEFTGNIPDIKHAPLSRSHDYHGHVGSLRVTADSAYSTTQIYPPESLYQRYKPAPVPTIVRTGVCVFERPNFQGQMQCWAGGTDITDLGPSWGDRIESVRIFGDGKLLAYTDPNFQGDRIVIYSDVADLNELPLGMCCNWNNQISSLQVQ